MSPGRHILIIGGGASGLILAAHLLRDPDPGLRLTVVERRDRLGQGVAYDTPHDAHLLNTRVGAMSAFADEPDHFHDWLAGRGIVADRQAFVPRHFYADYLASLAGDDPRLRWERQECLTLGPAGRGRLRAGLAGGGVILADTAVLATGHLLPGTERDGPPDADPASDPVSDPWHEPLPPPDARVLILGTGLTMVDRVMRLLEAGHRGEIVILSRRGLLPRVNGPSRPIELDRADLPLGAGAGYALKWLRAQVRWHEARGGDWRDIVDGARGHLALWWQSVPAETRGRFLRHARRFWEIHRHRTPAAVAARLEAARATGQLRLVTGRLAGAVPVGLGPVGLGPVGDVQAGTAPALALPGGDPAAIPPGGAGFRARLALRGGAEQVIEVAQISDGRGLLRDPEAHATPLIRDLLAQGLARIDALRIGLEVTPEGRVVPRPGIPAADLYAIGPAARSASWEALAIVDIRAQAASLAARMATPTPLPRKVPGG